MATNIPPHNLNEVLDGCLAYIDNENITIDELMQYIPGPDFPTAALINGRKGLKKLIAPVAAKCMFALVLA